MTSRSLPLLSISVLMAGGCNEIVGNGQPTSETRPLADFTQVANHGSLDVIVTQIPASSHEGPDFVVGVSADSNLVPLITTTVANGTLSVGQSKSFSSNDPARVYVDLPVLAGAENEGSGSLSVTANPIPAAPTQAIALTNSGSGILTFSGQAQAVSVDLSGSGATTLSGTGASLDGSLDGSGSLDASQFPVGKSTFASSGSGQSSLKVTGNAMLSVGGSGNIQATLNGGTVNLSVSGSGSINWTGNATVGSSTITGSGSITHH